MYNINMFIKIYIYIERKSTSSLPISLVMDTSVLPYLATVNNAAAVPVSVFLAFGGYMLRRIAGSWDNSIFSFLIGLLFSIVAAPIYILTVVLQGFPLLQHLLFVGFFFYFYDSHSDRHEVIPCGFSSHFSDA